MKYIASCSCGKDSLAMVYKLIKENYPLDEIVFYDTGMEFNSIYKNWEKLKTFASKNNISCITLKPKKEFEYMMFEHPHKSRKSNEIKFGYSWCGGMCRWGTQEKILAVDKYCEENNALCYVGIAADESQRLGKERKSYKLFPLNDWGMSEADCLLYCRNIGIDWIEDGSAVDLYDILDRVSCWCCANKNHWELYNYWKYLPTYWERLKELQQKNIRPFKKQYTIFDLEEKFKGGYIPKHIKRRHT